MTWHPRNQFGAHLRWRGKCTHSFADVADDDVADDWSDDVADDCAELLAWRVNPVQLQRIGWRRRMEIVARVVARGQCCRRRVLARAGMQYVGSSTGFHQWILLFFLYAMVMSKTRVENFYFWVWIKHPLFQEQALIPVVGKFQNSNTHQFTLFGNLPTPRSYWFVLIKLRNNTNNKTKEEEKIFSTQLKLSLSRFSLCVLHTPTLQLFTKHTYILS
jgi:hypothetical protein